jgi:hypothetical protein
VEKVKKVFIFLATWNTKRILSDIKWVFNLNNELSCSNTNRKSIQITMNDGGASFVGTIVITMFYHKDHLYILQRGSVKRESIESITYDENEWKSRGGERDEYLKSVTVCQLCCKSKLSQFHDHLQGTLNVETFLRTTF